MITPERLKEIRQSAAIIHRELREGWSWIALSIADRVAVGCDELLAEVTELRATLNDAHDGGNKAAKYWRELQESRRENADLRAEVAHLAAENAELRRDLAGQAEANSADKP